MVHAGATVLDHLPHGSFFHATAGSVNMTINERLKLIPYESLIGSFYDNSIDYNMGSYNVEALK